MHHEAGLTTLSGTDFDSYGVVYQLTSNGHTVQVDLDAGSLANAGGQSYKLAQFHFHAPSKHTIDGHSRHMELPAGIAEARVAP